MGENWPRIGMGLVIEMPEFEPMQHVRFRNKAINELSRDELIEALVQSLREVHRLRTSS
jgi:hypothetical protein